MARYRMNMVAQINEPFMLVSTQVMDAATEELRDKPMNRQLYSSLVQPGDVVEVRDDQIPGPAWDPLDDAAKAACEKHHEAWRPERHNTLDGLSMTLEDDARDAKQGMLELKEAMQQMASAFTAAMAPHEAPKLSLRPKG